MMTSIAFILGLVPLVTANGAAQVSRRAVGTPVFAGMLGASTLGIFLIPMLYVVFQTLREKVKARFGRKGGGRQGHGGPPEATPVPAQARARDGTLTFPISLRKASKSGHQQARS